MLNALAKGDINALARSAISNADVAMESEGSFVVTTLDDAVEYGGFAAAADETELLALLNQRIDFLTDQRRIGYSEWRADPTVFMQRAAQWRKSRLLPFDTLRPLCLYSVQ